MTKQELIKRGAHYFDDKNVKVMYATEDGNFFHESALSYADSHAKTKNIQRFKITRADLPKKKTDKKGENEVKVKPEKQEEIKEEQIKQDYEAEEKIPKNNKSKK